jgi:hypothetical protein
MATELLASGTAADSSPDVTVADGAAVTVIQRGRGRADIEAKNTTGYVSIGFIDDNRPAWTVLGPIVFRVSRAASLTALAVDREG